MEDKHHECYHEKELGSLSAIVEELSKKVLGNGKEGFVTILPRLEANLLKLSQSVDANITLTSALAKSLTEFKTIESYKNENSGMNWMKAGIIMTTIVSIAAVIVTIIFKK